jgi:hypothetical protein
VNDSDKHASLLQYKMVTVVKGFILQDLGSDSLQVSVLKFEERPSKILLIYVFSNNKKNFSTCRIEKHNNVLRKRKNS